MATRYKIISLKDKATSAEAVQGTDDTKYVTPLSVQPYSNNSLYRQAIINGNFDVWQRGTSLSGLTGGADFLADKFYDTSGVDGGTAPTITNTRGILTSGDIDKSFYYKRLTVDGAGTSLGASSYHWFIQKIENGTRKLCGLNKTVTVSFYARSSIANKRLGLSLFQNYGSGGSPSAQEIIVTQAPITLTSTWTKYTVTFTTNTLAGKTFGTDNNDFLRPNFAYMWGTTTGNGQVYPSVTAETYVGAGTIDIAQIQLNSGSVALPFQPKSYAEELRDCQRYYELVGVGSHGKEISTSVAEFFVRYTVPKRAIPATPTLTTTTPAISEIGIGGKTGSNSAISAVNLLRTTGVGVAINGFSGLTTGNPCTMNNDDIIISAEL